MTRPWIELAIVLVLAAGVTVSGVWIVRAEHQSRQLFIRTEALSREQDQLEIDWGRLQIEQSTYATHPRIESLARERLDLTVPNDDQLVVVVEPEASGR
jgi:cell division protein FtsL